jgi:hypothetical protein
MSITRQTSITVTHTAMPAPSPLTWDIRYTSKASSSDWQPTAWTRTPFQRVKLQQWKKQKADAILHAARALGREIPWQCLIRETDNVGRKAVPSMRDWFWWCGLRW